jgi:hypothetical protein
LEEIYKSTKKYVFQNDIPRSRMLPIQFKDFQNNSWIGFGGKDVDPYRCFADMFKIVDTKMGLYGLILRFALEMVIVLDITTVLAKLVQVAKTVNILNALAIIQMISVRVMGLEDVLVWILVPVIGLEKQ